MHANRVSQIAQKGVLELGLEWPQADSIYELKIRRTVQYGEETERRRVTNHQEYLDFLYLHVFPLIEQLEKDANIEYWHILNHQGDLDLRLLILNENQKEEVKKVLAQHSIVENPLEKWKVYGDPHLGCRLGCQALLRLYNAQSKFVRDLVRSIHWLRENPDHEVKQLISSIEGYVPIYTSHMLLNMFFPGDVGYEVRAHLQEAVDRLGLFVEHHLDPQEPRRPLHVIQQAYRELRQLLNPKDTEQNE